MSAVIIAARIFISILVGLYAKMNGLSGWGYAIGAFIISPLFAWIVAAILRTKTNK